VPRVKSGHNSYRNLVSSCLECNSLKGERPAADFLRWLYRQRRLTSAELNDRLRTLDALASGKLPPPVQHPDTPIGTPAHHPKSVIPSAARNPLSPSHSFTPSLEGSPATRHHYLGRKGRPPGSKRRPFLSL
jgi:hypothetical protein